MPEHEQERVDSAHVRREQLVAVVEVLEGVQELHGRQLLAAADAHGGLGDVVGAAL